MSNRGFTLIEAVVSSAVFVFVVTSVLGVYIATLRLDSRTRAERTVQENARFIMEYLAKLVRNGTIYYAAYPSQNAGNTSTELWVLNQADELEHLFLTGSDLQLTKGVTTNLNSSGVRVTGLQFLVAPSLNPLNAAKLSNQQPSLTAIVELTSNYGDKIGDVVTMHIQTTLASRDYPSREP